MRHDTTTRGCARSTLSPGQELVLVFALYLLLAAVLTYPVITGLGSHIPGFGDAPRMVWDVWRFASAITDPEASPTTTNLIFHPLPAVSLTWEGVPSLLIALPVEWAFGPVVAYNSLFFLSFVLSASLTYLVARHLSASRVASFVAGLVFAFSAYQYAQGTGRVHVFSTQWLPLFLLSLLELWEKRTVGRAMLLSVAMAAVVMNSPYYALYFLAPLLVWFFLYHLWRHRSRLLERRFLSGVALALAVAAAGTLVVYPRLLFADRGTAAALTRATGDTERYSADLLAFLLPARDHPVFGSLVAPVYDNFTAPENLPEMTVYLGYGALLLAAWGLRARGRNDVAFWAILALIGFFLSLGPILHVNGDTLFPLPYAALQRLPFFGKLRNPNRACVTLLLPMAVLASYGLSDLLDKVGNRAWIRYAVGALVVSCICFETLYAFPYPVLDTTLPAFYQELASDMEEGALFEVPSGLGNQSSTSWRMFYQIYHHREIAQAHLAREPLAVILFPHWVLHGELLSPPVTLLESDNWPAFEAAFGRLLAYNEFRYVIAQRQAGPLARPYSEEEYEEVRVFLRRSLGEPVYEDEGLVAHRVSPQEVMARATFSGQLELLDHLLVESTSCPDGRPTCTFLVTFWRANSTLDADYHLRLQLTEGDAGQVVGRVSQRLGYQFSVDDSRARYRTSWWAPGVVVADYSLLPSTDSEGVPLSGPLEVRLRVVQQATKTTLTVQSEHYAIDDRGRLVIGSYSP
jgi:hypothetical protein